MKTFHTTTLGCKINQYETRAIEEAWLACGYERSEQAAGADVLLVNSCAVTANAVSDLRQTVRRLNRDNPEAEIVLTGCAAQVLAEELALLPGVVRVVPQEEKADLLSGPQPRTGASSPENACTGDAGADRAFPAFEISGYGRSRAVVKVQDGCSHRCTYCIVPLTRGKSVSRPLEDILNEVDRLLGAGFREFVLSGVNLRQFGRDLPEAPDFWDLVELLEDRFALAWAGRARFRISSLEPGQLGDRALNVLGRARLICPQLHISLQSGDREVLKAMGRGHYRPEQLSEFLERLARVWPVFGLGADLIAGFPGETDGQFANTLAFCEGLPLSYAHVFPYSPRQNTPAAAMKGQLDKHAKARRAKALRSLATRKKKDFLRRVARLDRVDVLMQDATTGLEEHYIQCRFVTGTHTPRTLVRARPVGVEGQTLLVEPLAGEDKD